MDARVKDPEDALTKIDALRIKQAMVAGLLAASGVGKPDESDSKRRR